MPLLDFMVIEHILSHLPLANPSMFWRLCRVSEEWSNVVRKTTTWNALQIVQTTNFN